MPTLLSSLTVKNQSFKFTHSGWRLLVMDQFDVGLPARGLPICRVVKIEGDELTFSCQGLEITIANPARFEVTTKL
jgi:hypothetical protein